MTAGWQDKPDVPGHTHPPWPSYAASQKICRRGDTFMCAAAGAIGCPLCVHDPCPACDAAMKAATGL